MVERIHYDNDCYSINSALDISTDADKFLQYWRSGRSKERKESLQQALPNYQKAASLYRGHFLEDVHRKLILSYYRLGYHDKAIRQYYKCTEILRKELNIEPSQSTRELFRLISAEKDITMALF